MSRSAIIMMAVILTLVWGGFALILITAARREKDKTKGGIPSE